MLILNGYRRREACDWHQAAIATRRCGGSLVPRSHAVNEYAGTGPYHDSPEIACLTRQSKGANNRVNHRYAVRLLVAECDPVSCFCIGATDTNAYFVIQRISLLIIQRLAAVNRWCYCCWYQLTEALMIHLLSPAQILAL